MTRERARPAVLARKVLLPPALAVAAVACMLAAIALTAASGSRASGNPLADGVSGRQLGLVLSADLERLAQPRDVRRARRPLPERLRVLRRHPYFRHYTLAQRRFGVPWVLVASVHYQETGFRRGTRRDDAGAVMAIAARLGSAQAYRGLGASAQRAVRRRYGASAMGRASTAMVVERARAWRRRGALPRPGRGELVTPAAGVVGGCGHFGCPRSGHLHDGLDFLAPTGTPVRAADAGEVVLLQAPGQSGGYGNFVCLQHRRHLASCYAHLSAFEARVREGTRVRRAEIIGRVGSTGSSTAPHLHFEVRAGPAECQGCAVDPLGLLPAQPAGPAGLREGERGRRGIYAADMAAKLPHAPRASAARAQGARSAAGP